MVDRDPTKLFRLQVVAHRPKVPETIATALCRYDFSLFRNVSAAWLLDKNNGDCDTYQRALVRPHER